MPRQYPYIVVSLPLLEFGAEVPMTPAELVEYCTGLVRPGDLAGLRLASAGRFAELTEPAVRRYTRREVQLRNALARQRAGRAGVDADRCPR